MILLNFFKPKPPVVEPGRDRLKSWQIQSLQAELKVLLYKAFNTGILVKCEYEAGTKRVDYMLVAEMRTDIDYYRSLLESKAA